MQFSLKLFIFLSHLSCGALFAQQQAPVQNAAPYNSFPSSKYDEVKSILKNKKNSDYQGSLSRGVTLEWNNLPLVRKWHILIALDQEMIEVIHVGESAMNAFTTPALPSGEYYFVARGLNGERLIGQTEATKFAIGESGLETEEALPAPRLIFPAKDQLFPPAPKIRLSWEAIPGAKSYRVQIWDDELAKERLKNQKLPQARWITEVENNFLEIHDVPYSSYTYLQPSTYRWDITPISENTSKLGQMSSSKFEVSKKYYLEPEVYLRGWLERGPSLEYLTSSPVRGEKHIYRGTSDGMHLEYENWLSRSFGLNAAGGIRILRLQPSGNYTSYDLQASLSHRINLSRTKYGMQLIFIGGLTWQEFIMVDVEDTGSITRPVAFGPSGIIRAKYRFESPWEVDASARAIATTLTIVKNSEVDKSFTPLNYVGQITFRYFLSPHFAATFGITHENRKVMFQAKPYGANSIAQYSGSYFQGGLQLDY